MSPEAASTNHPTLMLVRTACDLVTVLDLWAHLQGDSAVPHDRVTMGLDQEMQVLHQGTEASVRVYVSTEHRETGMRVQEVLGSHLVLTALPERVAHKRRGIPSWPDQPLV